MQRCWEVSERLPQINELDVSSTRRNDVGRKPSETRRRRPLFRIQTSLISQIATCLLILLLCSDFLIVQAHPASPPKQHHQHYRTRGKIHVRRCKVYDNQILYTITDRICTACHDAFSHLNPNMRSDCRADCFATPVFKECHSFIEKLSKKLTDQSNIANELV